MGKIVNIAVRGGKRSKTYTPARADCSRGRTRTSWNSNSSRQTAFPSISPSPFLPPHFYFLFSFYAFIIPSSSSIPYFLSFPVSLLFPRIPLSPPSPFLSPSTPFLLPAGWFPRMPCSRPLR
ncbi:hypothetical protein LDENG_00152410 [Lucifuga dentata]|nr:hypothetical protein LDENG_00152410 [Lucifuga dentata]